MRGHFAAKKNRALQETIRPRPGGVPAGAGTCARGPGRLGGPEGHRTMRACTRAVGRGRLQGGGSRRFGDEEAQAEMTRFPKDNWPSYWFLEIDTKIIAQSYIPFTIILIFSSGLETAMN